MTFRDSERYPTCNSLLGGSHRSSPAALLSGAVTNSIYRVWKWRIASHPISELHVFHLIWP